jgi:hypothetical protein
MPDFSLTPLKLQDTEIYKYTRSQWLATGTDDFTAPPNQHPDSFMKLINVLPPATNAIQRRFGYVQFNPKLDVGTGDEFTSSFDTVVTGTSGSGTSVILPTLTPNQQDLVIALFSTGGSIGITPNAPLSAFGGFLYGDTTSTPISCSVTLGSSGVAVGAALAFATGGIAPVAVQSLTIRSGSIAAGGSGTFANPVTPGNLIVFAVTAIEILGPGGALNPVPSDNTSNFYRFGASVYSPAGGGTQVWLAFAENAVGGTTTITVPTLSGFFTSGGIFAQEIKL